MHVLATVPGDPACRGRRTAHVAGASSVECIDFDARAPETHPDVIDKAFAGGDIDVSIVAFGIQGDDEQALGTEAGRRRGRHQLHGRGVGGCAGAAARRVRTDHRYEFGGR